ncbi:sigma-70 family RNA polymerase sigma factor [soil metagenome]
MANRRQSELEPFEIIVERFGPMVLRVCRAVVGRDEAEDAWSETFLSAMRAYPELDSNANVEAWLVTIAKRKAIDFYRQSQRNPDPVDVFPESPLHDDHPSDRDDDLWEALESLPRKQREAIAYHHIAGLPYAEVGPLLGNSEAAARRAAADGIKRLRDLYQGARK